jgi:RimJ/RimL family protein N-acetyltransferase
VDLPGTVDLGSGLSLVRATLSDAAAIYRIGSQEGVTRHLPLETMTCEDDGERFLGRLLEAARIRGGAVWAITDAGGCIGIVDLLDWRPETCGFTLAYLLDPACWGKGTASRVVAGLLATLPDAGVRMLLAPVFRENAASARVLVKNGFALSRTETLEIGALFQEVDFFERTIG